MTAFTNAPRAVRSRSADLGFELMVDPRSGAWCAIRDTRAAGDERYYWTVTVIGEPNPVAAGRAGDVGVARSLAELALGA
jgi:hypothetical protein